jgi:hypothetical protein
VCCVLLSGVRSLQYWIVIGWVYALHLQVMSVDLVYSYVVFYNVCVFLFYMFL